MADYKVTKEQNAVMKNELETLRTYVRMSEFNSVNGLSFVFEKNLLNLQLLSWSRQSKLILAASVKELMLNCECIIIVNRFHTCKSQIKVDKSRYTFTCCYQLNYMYAYKKSKFLFSLVGDYQRSCRWMKERGEVCEMTVVKFSLKSIIGEIPNYL